jgi:ATPase subunit of ABC transporter with duplicated ATPase domains
VATQNGYINGVTVTILDVDTLTELEDLLDGWPGSLVVVSHDRYFLERVTDHVIALLGDGKLSFDAELRAVQDEKAQLEEQWLTIAESLPS